MRDIKFRAWVKHYDGKEEMIYYPSWSTLHDYTALVFEQPPHDYVDDSDYRNDISLMQYTGLKSSDGECGLPIKDAYFGDIIRFYNTNGKEIKAEIVWHEKEHCIGFQRSTDGFIYTQRIFNDSGYFQPSKINFEIIGNIYESPELLEPKEI